MPHKAICIKMVRRGVGSEDFGALIPRLMCTDRIAFHFLKKLYRHVSLFPYYRKRKLRFKVIAYLPLGPYS